jgi:hypothetical protein
MYSEEEFQMQLAMALSASNSDLLGDRDGDQIRDAKLMSLAAGDRRFRAAGRDDAHTAESLSRRYWVSPLSAQFTPGLYYAQLLHCSVCLLRLYY